jgi:membrane protein required for colicin V production
MKIFDILAGLLLLVSAANGLMKGAAHEVVRVMSFLIAAVTALVGLRITGPMMGQVIDPPWMASTVAVLGLFILVYITLRLLGASLAHRVAADSTLTALDRGVGVGFGLIRAIVVLGMFGLLFNAAAPTGGGPSWVTSAALFPLTQASAKVLAVFTPKAGELTGKIVPAITSAVHKGATSTPDEGYSDGERRRLDDLVESAR